MTRLFATVASFLLAYILAASFLPGYTFFTVAGFGITLALCVGLGMAYAVFEACD